MRVRRTRLGMKLSAWLTKHGVTDTAFGRQIGKSHSTVARLKRGEIRPTIETIEAIYDATKGDVTPHDFMVAPQGRRNNPPLTKGNAT